MPRGEHAREQFVGQRFAGLPMPREQVQRLALPAEVLHELAGQFDRVPFHAVDAGDARVIDFGEQMMQAVAEFVEQRGDFVMREQARAIRGRRRKIAGEVGDRQMRRVAVAETRTAYVHPRSATLAGARIQIDIAAGEDATVRRRARRRNARPDARRQRRHARASSRQTRARRSRTGRPGRTATGNTA